MSKMKTLTINGKTFTVVSPTPIASITLRSNAWVGNSSPYYQVVPLVGITENSQINLTPTVDQIAIFYEKDITFVTENAGGTLTIYVFGQKPTNDYTIPADIVEVEHDGPKIYGIPIATPINPDKLPSSGTVSDEQIAAAVDKYFTKNPASGLTTAQINALDGLFKIATYTEDASGAYAKFKAAFGIGREVEPDEPDEPDTPVVVTYTVSAELVNVTSSNKASTVNENASYTATLTAADGYNLDSVTVTMGGVDITATAYAAGVVTIAAVTGNVEIVASASVAATEPELLTDGLLSYFDLRDLGDKANVTVGTTKGVTATRGDGALFSWAGIPVTSSDNYGAVLPRALLYTGDGNAAQSDLGNAYSVVLMVHGGVPGLATAHNTYHTQKSNVGYGSLAPRYKTNSGEAICSTVAVDGDKTGYSVCAMTVNGSVLKMYFHGQLAHTFNGADYDGFQSWIATAGCGTIYNEGHTTAYAVYNRALTDAEITEMTEYMKTLEVTA